MFDLHEALKNLPDHPGVYIMKDNTGDIIYIGKAVSLKNRVRQYFQNSKNMHIKVRAMVSNVSEFEYMLTDSEMEALILECNLIKTHKPRYNILLKDDKQYPYIKVTIGDDYPRVLMVRKMIKDGSKYYGPYTDSYAVKEILQLFKKMYPIRSCSKSIVYGKTKERPCLNYFIKRCIAPCQGNIAKEEYGKMIQSIMEFLSGKTDSVEKELRTKMEKASEDMEYEKAAEIRDQLIAIDRITEKQKIVSAAHKDEDIIACAKGEDKSCIEIFFIRGGKLLGRENFFFDDLEDAEGTTLRQFIMQFYSEREYIPKEILLQSELDEISVIEEYLTRKKGSKVSVSIPKRGDKNELVELARKNADAALEQLKYRIKKTREETIGAVEELAAVLELDVIPTRIESYDISNIMGTDSVGSMVVFEDGKPKNKDYRRFKIKTVVGPDDYSSMEEVLTRRFSRGVKEAIELRELGKEEDEGKFSVMPDLILMDGGQGQVGIALKVLKQAGLEIPVCGMVKDDKHRTRGLIYNDQEISMYKDSNAFKLITRIQDEVHRTAISYHRSLRNRKTLSSELDEIKSIGEKRRRALLTALSSIDEIKAAPVERLKNIEGMNEKAAMAVYEYFHGKQNKDQGGNK